MIKNYIKGIGAFVKSEAYYITIFDQVRYICEKNKIRIKFSK